MTWLSLVCLRSHTLGIGLVIACVCLFRPFDVGFRTVQTWAYDIGAGFHSH